MSDSSDQQPSSSEPDPFTEFLRQFGITPTPGQPLDLQQLLAQLQAGLTQPGASAPPGMGLGFHMPDSGVSGDRRNPDLDWTQLKQLARQMTATLGPDPSPGSDQRRSLAEAERLAELWLDDACDFAQVQQPALVWSRAEWIEQTMVAWRQVVEPIMTSMTDAMTSLLDDDGSTDSDEPGSQDMLGQLSQMLRPLMRQLGHQMYGSQFAHAIAALAHEIVSGSEMGIQVLPRARVAMLSANIERQFGDVDLPDQDVLIHLTLRETARQRLFQQVGWLAPQMLALVEHYARGIRIDTAALEQTINVDDMSALTPDKLMEMSNELQGKLFEPTRTDEQNEVLSRLETLVALVEGWVDEVVARAASRWMPNHGALNELIRRRRGMGGPTENVFNALVGLELRPRRIRDAANLWAAMTTQRGQAARDALWHHPDLLPTAAALDDPLGFVNGEFEAPASDDLDAELARMIEQERGNE